ncbi:hypothetical protein HK405_005522 [Cladochytrium tenue]|nr:hypothetical protein HK405_005522 [Cladochytrium tenue]
MALPEYRSTGTIMWPHPDDFDENAKPVDGLCLQKCVNVNAFLVDKARTSWATEDHGQEKSESSHDKAGHGSDIALSYLPPEAPWVALKLVELLENVSKDSGIPTRTPPIPTPGRLANVRFNHNVGDANGDPSDPLADLPEVQDGFPYPPLSGRAVLITAAQEDLVPLAVGSARAVRRTGSVLPIEIWAAAAADVLANATAALLDLADISVHHLPDISESNAEVTAALLSQQREVVVISANNYAAADPAALFETAEYKETGTILWSNGFFGSIRASQKSQNYLAALEEAVAREVDVWRNELAQQRFRLYLYDRCRLLNIENVPPVPEVDDFLPEDELALIVDKAIASEAKLRANFAEVQKLPAYVSAQPDDDPAFLELLAQSREAIPADLHAALESEEALRGKPDYHRGAVLLNAAVELASFTGERQGQNVA